MYIITSLGARARGYRSRARARARAKARARARARAKYLDNNKGTYLSEQLYSIRAVLHPPQ